MKIRYYQTPGGRSPVEEFLLGLPEATRLEVADAIVLLESGQALEMPLNRNLASIRPGLHELRFRDKAGQVRVIYYLKKGDAIYLVHAFRKKTQTIPRRELEIIHKRLKEI
jgi:phage-related protein